MSFSLSTFTVEIDGRPTIVFQTKWQAEADEMCRSWVDTHWDEIAKTQINRIEVPIVLKVRLARAAEKAAYAAEAGNSEFLNGARIVSLIGAIER